MYIIYGEMDRQPRLDAWDKCSGLVHWETQRDQVEMEWEGVSGWGTHVNPWLIHVNVWQNMYIIYGEMDRQPRLHAWDKCSGLVH